MELFKSNYHIISTVLFIVLIIVAHVYSPSNYNWLNNTISDLGAQGYERRLIMQIGFLIFGIMLAAGVLLNGVGWRTAPLLVYGLCVSMTGVFSTKPFTDHIEYSALQSSLHSSFAQIAGVAFCVAMLLQFSFSSADKSRNIHLLFFILVIGLSATFGLLKNYQGIAQRLLYLISFIWLIRYFKP
jgi:hypothetical membrane protein